MSFVVDAIGRRWRALRGEQHVAGRRLHDDRRLAPAGAARRRRLGERAGRRQRAARAAAASRRRAPSRRELERLAGRQRARVDVGVELEQLDRRHARAIGDRRRRVAAARRSTTLGRPRRVDALGGSWSRRAGGRRAAPPSPPPLVTTMKSDPSSSSASSAGSSSGRYSVSFIQRRAYGARRAGLRLAQRPRRLAQALGLARARRAAGAPPCARGRAAIEREALTSPPARPGGERRREVLDAAALRADARQQERRARHELAHARDVLGRGRADDGADVRQPARRAGAAEPRDDRRQALPDASPPRRRARGPRRRRRRGSRSARARRRPRRRRARRRRAARARRRRAAGWR